MLEQRRTIFLSIFYIFIFVLWVGVLLPSPRKSVNEFSEESLYNPFGNPHHLPVALKNLVVWGSGAI